jgi:hypothetical protein
MSDGADGAVTSPPAWQPFTFGGVAAFARARVGRLLLAEAVAALLLGAICVGFLQHAFVPVIFQAIEEMPEGAKIAGGRLSGVNTTIISATRHLGLAVTPEPRADIGQSSDIQFQFRPSNFRVGSVFRPDWGWEFGYDPAITLDLSRANLEPWWGAWRPVCLAVAGVSVVVGLLIIWAALALIYTVPVKLLAWFADRDLTWNGAWQLSAAGLLPGACLLGLAIFLYGTQSIDVIALGFFYMTHFVSGWIYAVGGTLACPRLERLVPPPNPFGS